MVALYRVKRRPPGKLIGDPMSSPNRGRCVEALGRELLRKAALLAVLPAGGAAGGDGGADGIAPGQGLGPVGRALAGTDAAQASRACCSVVSTCRPPEQNVPIQQGFWVAVESRRQL